jgi:hypothetical protein
MVSAEPSNVKERTSPTTATEPPDAAIFTTPDAPVLVAMIITFLVVFKLCRECTDTKREP